MDIQLKRGLLDVCVLAAIKDEDSYGYQIIKDIKPYVEISESTLYPILRRLESAQLLTVRTAEHNGRLRKYYHITPLGLSRIEDFKAEWREIMLIYKFVAKRRMAHMDKIDFLYALQQKLQGLPEDDISRSMDYYNEMIDDRMEEGMTEQEAVADLGNIDDIAEQILLETPLAKLVKAKVKPRRTLHAWEIVLLILGSPIWLSLIIAAFAVVLAVYVSLWAGVIALHASGIAVAATAVAGFVCATILILFGNLPMGLFMLGASLICAGLSILMFFTFNQVTRGVAKLGKLIFIGIKRCFIRKERKK